MAFQVTRRVEFADTDMAGIMHFAAFYDFMEAAEHALLRSIGLGVFMEDAEGQISWPRVSSGCDYASPAHCGELLTTEVAVERIGNASVTYLFRIRHEDRDVARGTMTSVCCRIAAGQPPQPIAIPETMRQALASATE